MRILLAIFIAIFSLDCLAEDSVKKEKACLADSCFTKEIQTEDEAKIRDKYQDLVASISGDTEHLIHYTDDFLRFYPENYSSAFKKHFKWIKNDSLEYIIVSESYSALLLIKSESERRVLYYNHQVGKFEVSFDSPEEYESVDKHWVNSTTELKIGV